VPLYRAEVKPRRLFGKPRLHDPSQVLYLSFDKDDGAKVRDRSGYNNHGTIYGATRVSGKIGDALSFDGVDDYAQVPHKDYFNAEQDFTIMMWIKGTVPAYDVFAHKYGSPGLGWFLSGTDTRKGRFLIDDTVVNPHVVSSKNVLDGEFHHLCAQRDKSAKILKIYVDGELDGTVTDTTTKSVANTFSVQFGKHRISGFEFPGVIDEVRIFPQLLSQAEIQRIMNKRRI